MFYVDVHEENALSKFLRFFMKKEISSAFVTDLV